MRILKSWFLGFLGQNWRVNNLATYRSITWPHFPGSRIFWVERWPSYWPSMGSFPCFSSVKSFFPFVLVDKNLILPAERRRILKNKKQWNKGGQVIWLMVAKLFTLQHILSRDMYTLYDRRMPLKSRVQRKSAEIELTDHPPLQWELHLRNYEFDA